MSITCARFLLRRQWIFLGPFLDNFRRDIQAMGQPFVTIAFDNQGKALTHSIREHTGIFQTMRQGQQVRL